VPFEAGIFDTSTSMLAPDATLWDAWPPSRAFIG
jgi:hypothetical protein